MKRSIDHTKIFNGLVEWLSEEKELVEDEMSADDDSVARAWSVGYMDCAKATIETLRRLMADEVRSWRESDD